MEKEFTAKDIVNDIKDICKDTELSEDQATDKIIELCIKLGLTHAIHILIHNVDTLSDRINQQKFNESNTQNDE